MKIFFLMILLSLLIPFGASGDEEKPSSSGTLSLLVENDVLVGRDRDYTSGMKLSWTSRWIPALETESDDQEKTGRLASSLDMLPFLQAEIEGPFRY
jgi:hypothetical protein